MRFFHRFEPRRLALRWLILTLGLLTLAQNAAADWPAWVERLLFNPTERTQRGIEHFGDGEVGDASEPLETALRLQGNDPVAQYNAGTARLSSGGDALSLLESAATGGAGDLVPAARYNLGKARLDSMDYPGAIEAFKEALRHDPGNEDAKFNLELAQKLLEEQQQEQQNQDQQNQDQDQQDQQNQDQQNQDQQDQEQQNQDQEQQNQDQQDQEQQNQDQQDQEQQQDQSQEQQDQEQQEQQQQEQQQSEQEQPGQQQEQERPLPQFEDLPDMTAEEAAAILEAIENMEREQRRQEALEAAKKHSGAKKDW
ncbi:MAG: hypothetical protein AAF560_21455 [Acidobacteriota bacterium]